MSKPILSWNIQNVMVFLQIIHEYDTLRIGHTPTTDKVDVCSRWILFYANYNESFSETFIKTQRHIPIFLTKKLVF